jgi:hypothetical protein
MMTGEYRRIEPSMLMMMVMVMFSHGRGEFVGSQEKILIKRSCLIWATSLDCGCGLKWFGIGLLSFYMGPGYVPSLGYQTSLLYMLVEWSLMFRGVTQRTYSNVSNKGIVSRILVRCFRTWRWVQIFYLILGGERKRISICNLPLLSIIYKPCLCENQGSRVLAYAFMSYRSSWGFHTRNFRVAIVRQCCFGKMCTEVTETNRDIRE